MPVFPTRELAAGSAFWCVCRADFPAAGFNPNAHGDPTSATVGGRFNPFETDGGERVATKYLADHPNGAFAETLLRDGPGSRELSRATIESHRVAQLALHRSLSLADLGEVSSTTFVRMMKQGHEAYPALRDVAATVHRQTSLAGLLWEGRQLDRPGMNCLMLFGDRLSAEDDLRLLGDHALDRGIGRRLLRAAARLRQVVLPKEYAVDPGSPPL